MDDVTEFSERGKSRSNDLNKSNRTDLRLSGNKNGKCGSDTEQIKGKAVFVK